MGPCSIIIIRDYETT